MPVSARALIKHRVTITTRVTCLNLTQKVRNILQTYWRRQHAKMHEVHMRARLFFEPEQMAMSANCVFLHRVRLCKWRTFARVRVCWRSIISNIKYTIWWQVHTSVHTGVHLNKYVYSCAQSILVLEFKSVLLVTNDWCWFLFKQYWTIGWILFYAGM